MLYDLNIVVQYTVVMHVRLTPHIVQLIVIKAHSRSLYIARL